MIEVFAYGTLRDLQYQRALFDVPMPTRPATLDGWQVVVHEGGFLTLVAAPGETVAGDLVALDDEALAIADAWEEVPLYERLRAEARTAAGESVPCWVYVRPTASRERPSAGALARHARREVLARIRDFRRGAGGPGGPLRRE
jgi:gamma-glutamylcyclotransferase (GGCT)/AIG2-like uncharacterized protein YtfP